MTTTGDLLRERILALAEHDAPEKGVMFERWLVDAQSKAHGATYTALIWASSSRSN